MTITISSVAIKMQNLYQSTSWVIIKSVIVPNCVINWSSCKYIYTIKSFFVKLAKALDALASFDSVIIRAVLYSNPHSSVIAAEYRIHTMHRILSISRWTYFTFLKSQQKFVFVPAFILFVLRCGLWFADFSPWYINYISLFC